MTTKTEKEEHDAMMRAFHKVPLANELEVMPDIDLAELQSQLPPDSPGRKIIENEWHRRKSSKVPNPTSNPLAQPNNPQWYQKPIGVVWLAAIGAVLAALVGYLIKKHFGIPL